MADLGQSTEHAAATDPSHEPFARLNLIGDAPAFRDVLTLIRKVASYDATVLIEGETGTGKELVARAIHYLGSRRDKPFIPVNCGAIPDALVESELFGHVRGAFTDARETRAGVIAQAQGGTLLLDEVQALSPHGQTALLRFLQDQQYRPLGGAATCSANVRVIATSNVDLAEMADQGRYRDDLLYRLNVLPIRVPSLRERGDDVTLLAEGFLRRFAEQYGRSVPRLHADAVTFLRRHSWPGNVRELENRLLREFLLVDGPVLRFGTPPVGPVGPETPQPPRMALRFRDAKEHAIREFEKRYLTDLLARAEGNVSLAARLAGKERSRLGKLLRKHGIARPHPGHGANRRGTRA